MLRLEYLEFQLLPKIEAENPCVDDVVQDEKHWPLMPALPSYGYGREMKGPRYGSLIHGQHLEDIVITGKR